MIRHTSSFVLRLIYSLNTSATVYNQDIYFKADFHVVQNIPRAIFSFCLRSSQVQASRKLFNPSNTTVTRAVCYTKRKSAFKLFSTRQILSRSDFFFCLICSRLELMRNLFNLHKEISIRDKIRQVENSLQRSTQQILLKVILTLRSHPPLRAF